MKNAEKALEEAVRSPSYQCLSGSRLYGTHREDSDTDLRGFTIPPFEYIIGTKTFESRELEGDHKIHSLKTFLTLALKGDPQMTEMFFIPCQCAYRISDVSSDVLSLKEHIISQNIYNRIMGYSYSEWNKAMGVKNIAAKRTVTEDQAIDGIRKAFEPDKETMDNMITALYSHREKKLVSSKGGVGAKRAAEFEKYGFGVSCATHAIRLLGELYELITDFNITFPRPNAEVLKDIRYGKYSKEEVIEIYDELYNRLKEYESKSILPPKPNYAKVWYEYSKIIVNFLEFDERFVELHYEAGGQ
jgi:hypothetical protein